jgi:hypothetical protein
MMAMSSPRYSLHDLVLLQEICLEQELRYEQRAALARGRDDPAQAEHELKRKQRFSRLKLQMYAYLHRLDGQFSQPDAARRQALPERHAA